LALPELTISDEERMKLEVKKLQTDISDMKTVEFQLAIKDKEIIDIRSRFDSMQLQMQHLMTTIGSLSQQGGKQEIVKKLIEKGMYKPETK
jgi:hypothetical protein